MVFMRVNDPDWLAQLDEHYRWWRCRVWHEEGNIGVKLGPISVNAYLWGWRPNLAIAFLGRWCVDTLWTGAPQLRHWTW